MSNLLQVTRYHPDGMDKKGATPIIIEVNVNPETAPYLVSASSGFMWIEESYKSESHFIKAAVQTGVTPGDLFWSAAKVIFGRAKISQWGNAQPFTKQGLGAAIDHVQSYDMGELDILVNQYGGKAKKPKWLNDFDERLKPTVWVPDNCAIVVPTDRQFLGILIHISSKSTATTIHNPSRGFAMCWDQ